ncbi:RNA-binding S4 domain-containing protein [Deminuibacter soli]|uniref:RNA-binding S4 domain-containing protein n=1 Tax=Deminuibacter soli TaxID=2291815 RepID=A0A3E1NNY5_9BACT|nr:RNA-binding S4 domain-containing protein [Deminuibacter soli]RFM29642.1 RNA-binding S4 domain-containing protein [Deminuibacter soli]
MAEAKEKLRIDKYLWAIRLFKTRSQAADACDKGKVKLNGSAVKASRTVNVGDEYEVKNETRKWVIKVSGLLDHRVQYSEAINYYTDLTPAEELDRIKFQAASFHTGKRLSKIGRPTKRNRRDIEGFMGEEEGEAQTADIEAEDLEDDDIDQQHEEDEQE